MDSPRFNLVAGEASGDLLGGLLLKGMRARWPNLAAAGIGGGHMQAQGFECWWPYNKLAVHGYVDALKSYRELSALRTQAAKRIMTGRPAALIGIDAPDFNLGLEKRVRQTGIKAVHFVSPSIWAWRGWRIKDIAHSTDLVLCLFPFEPAIYEKAGIAARYVGHPLADEIPLVIDRNQARHALGLTDAPDGVVAVMPGSRRSEIQQLASVFLETAKMLKAQRPGLRFVLPIAPNIRSLLMPVVIESGMADHVLLTENGAGIALAACDVALIASGTATLEAALYKRPMVIAYRVGAFSAMIMKHMGYLPWIGLPNILCDDTVVPERVQQAVNAPQLSRDILAWLDDPLRVKALQTRFDELHQCLRCNTAQTATHAIAELIER